MPREHLTEAFLAHLRDPVGLVGADGPDVPVSGHAAIRGRVAGSVAELWIRVDRRARLTHLQWRARLMPRVVPGLSVLAAWVQEGDGSNPGIPLEVALGLSPHDVADRLGGLPGRLVHEAMVGPDLLRDAITDYFVSIGLPDPAGRTPDPARHRTPPCTCLLETGQRLLEELGRAHATDSPPSPSLTCPSCRAFTPALRTWVRWRRRKPGREL